MNDEDRPPAGPRPTASRASLTRGRARKPSVTILCALEESPLVLIDCLDDGEEARLADWLDGSDLGQLLVAATELAVDWPRA